MPSVQFDPAGRELRITLEGLTEAEARAAFLALGKFLRDLSDRRLQCLGHHVAAATAPPGKAGATPCTFCVIAQKTEGKPKGCPF